MPFAPVKRLKKEIIDFGLGGYIMYDTKERVVRAKERADRLIRKREKRIIGGMSTLCLMLSCCLAAVIGKLSEGGGEAAVRSLAFLAASLARAARMHFSTMIHP